MGNSLNIIFYSGNFDRIHYGLMLASAAAATNRKTTVFVTMAACHAFTRNPELPLSDGTIHMPAKTAEELNMYYQQQGIATFEELLEACADLSVNFLVCEMGLRAAGLTLAELSPSLDFSECGIVTLLNEAENGNILFI